MKFKNAHFILLIWGRTFKSYVEAIFWIPFLPLLNFVLAFLLVWVTIQPFAHPSKINMIHYGLDFRVKPAKMQHNFEKHRETRWQKSFPVLLSQKVKVAILEKNESVWESTRFKSEHCKGECLDKSLSLGEEVVKPSFSTPTKLAFWTTFEAQKASFLVMSSFWCLSRIFIYLMFLICSMHSIRLGCQETKFLPESWNWDMLPESWDEKAGYDRNCA